MFGRVLLQRKGLKERDVVVEGKMLLKHILNKMIVKTLLMSAKIGKKNLLKRGVVKGN